MAINLTEDFMPHNRAGMEELCIYWFLLKALLALFHLLLVSDLCLECWQNKNTLVQIFLMSSFAFYTLGAH